MQIDLEDVTCIIREWVSRKDLIKEVYLFGSRVKGTFNEHSDLDIAIKLDYVAEDHGLSQWSSVEDLWKEELGKLIEYKIDLELYERNITKNIHEYLSEKNILVYSKE